MVRSIDLIQGYFLSPKLSDQLLDALYFREHMPEIFVGTCVWIQTRESEIFLGKQVFLTLFIWDKIILKSSVCETNVFFNQKTDALETVVVSYWKSRCYMESKVQKQVSGYKGQKQMSGNQVKLIQPVLPQCTQLSNVVHTVI